MAQLKVVTTLEIDVTGFEYRPTTTWSVGPGDPALLELLGWRLGINNADVETRNGEAYLRWRTLTMPTEEELSALSRRISEAVTEINLQLAEFRLFHKAVTGVKNDRTDP